ncbi:MAG: sulfotransferase, partial [Sphingomonadales bacterium]
WLHNWKVLNPSSVTGAPDEDVSSRIAEVKADVAWFDVASPDAKLAHSFAADEPEEDSMLMAQSLISPTLTGYADADSYVMWTLEAGMQHQFFYLRDALKYLIWQGLADPNKPFVLKSAMSYGFERDLLKAFPDAKLIMTHRDPLQCIPSACRLIELFNYAHSHKTIDHAARFEGMAWKMDLHLAFRDAEPDYPILDISYATVRAAATDVLAPIYDFADMPLTDQAVDAVGAWEVRNPKNKHGSFTYALEDFGLTKAGIQRRFDAYYRRFSKYF